jgi:hypothetical protein
MTADLRKISFHLRYKHYSGGELHTHSNPDGAEVLNDVLRAPWRYKHPPQTKSRSTKDPQRRTQRPGLFISLSFDVRSGIPAGENV